MYSSPARGPAQAKMQGEWTLVLLFVDLLFWGEEKGDAWQRAWLKGGFLYIKKCVCVGRVCDCVGGDYEKSLCALQP